MRDKDGRIITIVPCKKCNAHPCECEMIRERFTKALAEYMDNVQDHIVKHFEKMEFTFDPDQVILEPKGRRYKKVSLERHGGGKSVHSFVEVETGDIFKPASWKAPAKHKRGNIYENRGEEALTPIGHVRYLVR